MKIKTMGQLLIALLFFSGILRIVSGSSTSLSLGGGGVTVNLAFPEEAHPNATITHNITITSSTTVTLKNFKVVIKALVDSSWQEIFNGTNAYDIPPQLPQNYNLTLPLPQDAKGRLQCFILVNTSSIDELSATVYTTLVSEPTFSEMLADYNELLTEYNAQVASYESLKKLYTDLQSELSSVRSDLNTKNSEFSSLLTNYVSLNSTFSSLEGNYAELQGNYTLLEGFYNALNNVKTQIEADYNDLLSSSDSSSTADRIVMFILVMIVAGLIALIIYIRRRESEPYVIIRKETVALKPDKKS